MLMCFKCLRQSCVEKLNNCSAKVIWLGLQDHFAAFHSLISQTEVRKAAVQIIISVMHESQDFNRRLFQGPKC